MSFYFRAIDSGDDIKLKTNSYSWDLDDQVKECSLWITRNKYKLNGRKWILDIGYSDGVREGVVACGYTIPLSFMKKCVKYNITLWLSSYGERFDAAVADIKKI